MGGNAGELPHDELPTARGQGPFGVGVVVAPGRMFDKPVMPPVRRHITGLSSIVWGNDYPHAEGTFRGSRELIAREFAGVPAHERTP